MEPSVVRHPQLCSDLKLLCAKLRIYYDFWV